MSRRFSKVGAILLLLILLFGPMLQQRDCFNDAPNLDHDAVLHFVDGLLCVAFPLLIFGLLLEFLKVLRLSRHLPRRRAVSFASLCSAAPFPRLDTSPPSPLSLRI
jgi:hypothetical protein